MSSRGRSRGPGRAEAPASRTAGVAAPYKGLRPFQPEDAELFFGRDALRAELLARLAESRLLVLTGDSGSGKSSLLGAGLLPAIWAGVLPGSSRWLSVLLTPGTEPLVALATHLSAVRGISPASVLADLRRDPAALTLVARQALLDAPKGARVLVVVDQLEELFTMGAQEDERRAFLAALLHATAHRSATVTVVMAVRSDFLGRLASHDGLPEALRDRHVLVGPLADAELAEVIERPAEHVGATVQRELVDTVTAELRGEPGALPLLSHALLETFEHGGGRAMTVKDYVAVGGLRGAISKTADAALARMTSAERLIARQVLLRLTAVEDGAEPTRRRVPLAELTPTAGRAAAVQAVIDDLIRARLLTSGKETVEVAHEALIRHWPTLRRWIEEDLEDLRLHDELARAARGWKERGRDTADLLRGVRLTAAVAWSRGNPDRLNALERDFVAASRRAARDELERSRREARRLRALVGALGVLLLSAAVSAVMAFEQRSAAEREARTATSRRLAAESRDRLPVDVDAASLLALEAFVREPTAEARSALVAAVGTVPRLKGTLRGHAPGVLVRRLAFAPGGRLLASAGFDGTVRIWDAARARAAWAPLRPGGRVTSVAFGGAGRWLAAGGDRVWLWELGAVPRRLGATGNREGVLDVDFAGDRVLIATDQAGAVRSLRLPGLEPDAPLRARGGPVPAVSVGGGGSLVAAGDETTGRVLRWDLRTGSELEPLTTPEPLLADLAVAPEGRAVAEAGAGAVTVWERRSPGSVERRALDGKATPLGVAWGPAGSLAAAADDGSVHVWTSGRLEALEPPMRAHRGAAHGVAFSSDGETLASAGMDGTVRLWDAGEPGGVIMARTGARAPGSATTLSVDGRAVAVATRDGAVRYSAAAGERPLGARAHLPDRRIVALALAADGRRLATATTAGALEVWDPGAARPLRPAPGISLDDPVIALDRDGETLAAADFGAAGVRLIDVNRGRAGTPLPDSSHAVVGVGFSADGRLLAAASHDGPVRVWDARTRRRLLAPHVVDTGAAVGALAFAPGGRTVAAAFEDGGIRLWDLGARLETGTGTRLASSGPAAAALAFSADGRTLASANGRSIRLWDVARRHLLGVPLRGHDARITAVAFDRGGALVSADAGGGVVRWDPLLASESAATWRRRVCAMVGRGLGRDEWLRFLPGEPYRPECVEEPDRPT